MLHKTVFPTICLMALAGAAQATPMSAFPVDVQVTPWLAPNSYGSPSFPGAVANQEYALLHGLSSYGTPGTPEYYQAQSDVTSAEAIVTGFPSWKGMADPGAVYGSAFAGEYGNRMHFGLLALGDGTHKFSVSELSFAMWSTDPYGALDYALSGYNYSTELQGILYGADGKLGGGDDTFITSGSSSQLVDGLVGRGTGSSFAAYCPGCSIAQQQAEINYTASYPGSPFDFTGMYSIGSGSGFLGLGMGTFHVSSSVPEPASLALLGIGFLAMVVVTKRSQRTPKDQKS
ncbi:MAG: PEP-CTERM sorting domain-containing protein [Minisyncoccota bacterium]